MGKVFITGVTGYIGGTALAEIVKYTGNKHQISALVRDAAKASIVQEAYPDLRIVIGDLDDTNKILAESKSADVVLNLATYSHIESANVIAAGLSDAERSKPGYWIQISGASALAGAEISTKRFGEPPERNYDDLQDGTDIISAITESPKRMVEGLVLSQDASKVRTALIVGPLFYGVGSGPIGTRSDQIPEMTRVMLEKKRAFRLGRGLAVWSNLHILDLGSLFVALLEAAVGDNPKIDGVWNHQGIYAPENGRASFEQISKLLAVEAYQKGYLNHDNVDWQITPEEADDFTPRGSMIWGINADVRSSRAQHYLDWQPSQQNLEAHIAEAVRIEAGGLGLQE